MVNLDLELVYSPKQVHEHLRVSDSSLRKYAMALEARGYKFRKEDNGNRIFTQHDIDIFEILKQRLDAGQSMKTAASSTMNHVRKNVPRTVPVPVAPAAPVAGPPAVTERSSDVFKQKFEEGFAVLLEERIHTSMKPLIEGVTQLSGLVAELANQNKQLLSQNQELRTMLPAPRDIEEEKRQQREIVDEVKVLHEKQKKLEQQHYEELKRQNEEIQKLIPPMPDIDKERSERTNEYLTIRRINLALEKEAYEHWNRKPEHERIRKIGMFKKEENIEVRNHFIKSYIDEYFEDRLRLEFAQ
jgi:DNA-binding transcriptional MerR regulator